MIGEKAGDGMAAKICRILKIGQISLREADITVLPVS